MLYSLFYAKIGLRRLREKYKNHTSWIESAKVVNRTKLNGEVKQAQIQLNLLIGLMRITFK